LIWLVLTGLTRWPNSWNSMAWFSIFIGSWHLSDNSKSPVKNLRWWTEFFSNQPNFEAHQHSNK
jgi:hypothetical protein